MKKFYNGEWYKTQLINNELLQLLLYNTLKNIYEMLC